MNVREEVERVLNEIIDPCSRAAGAPASLIDMGLVRALETETAADGSVTVRVCIGITEPGCLMGGPFVVEARRRLAAIDGVGSLDVSMDHQMDWTPADMTPAYRDRLESVRAARRRQAGVIAVGRPIHFRTV
jgi:metal-sulfur cluster biosynthetic enzyme